MWPLKEWSSIFTTRVSAIAEPKSIQLNKYHGAPTAIVVNAARPSCPRIAADASAIHTTRMTRSGPDHHGEPTHDPEPDWSPLDRHLHKKQHRGGDQMNLQPGRRQHERIDEHGEGAEDRDP